MIWIAPSEKHPVSAAPAKRLRHAADQFHAKTQKSSAPIFALIFLLAALMAATAQSAPLGPGNQTRTLMMGDQQRSYLIHIPKGHNPKQPAPVILALHGAAMNAPMMAKFCGLNETSDKEGFIVVDMA